MKSGMRKYHNRACEFCIVYRLTITNMATMRNFDYVSDTFNLHRNYTYVTEYC
jgi:hypothetical protein